MVKVTIRNKCTGAVIFETYADSMKTAVEIAVAELADFRCADLRGADLHGAKFDKGGKAAAACENKNYF
jgi:uncharacterized protein YjbI with pentapeptide repeats